MLWILTTRIPRAFMNKFHTIDLCSQKYTYGVARRRSLRALFLLDSRCIREDVPTRKFATLAETTLIRPLHQGLRHMLQSALIEQYNRSSSCFGTLLHSLLVSQPHSLFLAQDIFKAY